MSSKQRLTILNQLKKDMLKIQATNNYNLDIARVERSYWDKSDVKEYPFLCFHCDSDEVYELTMDEEGGGVRTLNIRIFGYIPVEPPEFDPVHLFAEDVDKFLESNENTYRSRVEVGDIDIYEGTELDKVAFFVMSITITYDE